MSHQQDHFSAIASAYHRGRFGYPLALFDHLHQQCRQHDLAWDCATGSGQAAVGLAPHFSKVVATDISRELLAAAPPHPAIDYRFASAENSGLESHSVDLITVAQAIHWFDLPAFWSEANHVLKDRGVLAFWGYTWPQVNARIDAVLTDFHQALAGMRAPTKGLWRNSPSLLITPISVCSVCCSL